VGVAELLFLHPVTHQLKASSHFKQQQIANRSRLELRSKFGGAYHKTSRLSGKAYSEECATKQTSMTCKEAGLAFLRDRGTQTIQERLDERWGNSDSSLDTHIALTEGHVLDYQSASTAAAAAMEATENPFCFPNLPQLCNL
jgi:hypothetical protein